MNNKNNLINLKNFFLHIFKHNEASSTEIINALYSYLNYTLIKNNINPKNYEINFHFLKKFEDEKANAYMNADLKYENVYDIYFRSEFLTFKNKDDLDNFLTIMFDASHEITHIIQFIKNVKSMGSYVKQKDAVIEIFDNASADSKISDNCLKKLSKKLEKHSYYIDVVHPSEIEATTKGIENFRDMIVDFSGYLTREEGSVKFINFLNYCIDTFYYNLKEQKKFFKDIRYRDKQIKKDLFKNHHITKSDLFE